MSFKRLDTLGVLHAGVCRRPPNTAGGASAFRPGRPRPGSSAGSGKVVSASAVIAPAGPHRMATRCPRRSRRSPEAAKTSAPNGNTVPSSRKRSPSRYPGQSPARSPGFGAPARRSRISGTREPFGLRFKMALPRGGSIGPFGCARGTRPGPPDQRASQRGGHLPVQRHRGFDAAGEGAAGRATRRSWPSTGAWSARPSAGHGGPRGGHPGRCLLRRVRGRKAGRAVRGGDSAGAGRP